MSAEKIEVIMKKEKDCKHSIKYASEEGNSPLQSIYVKRPYTTGVDEIKVTIEPYHE